MVVQSFAKVRALDGPDDYGQREFPSTCGLVGALDAAKEANQHEHPSS
jgi:hypothetical protein